MSPRAGGRTGAGWRAAIVVVLVTVLGASGCAVSAENAAPAGGAAATGARSSDAPAPPAVSSQGSPPVPSVPSLTTDDLDQLLPGTSDDACLRPRWEVRDELWELGLLRGLCGADLASPSTLGSGAGSPEHDAEQWWQGTSPQYATLDVLRWPGDAPGGAEAWRDEVVADESGCREALVLPDQLAAEGGRT